MDILTAIKLLDPDTSGIVPRNSNDLIAAKRIAVNAMREILNQRSSVPLTTDEFYTIVTENYEDHPLFISDLSDSKSKVGYWAVPRFFDRAEGGSEVIILDIVGSDRKMLFMDDYKKRWAAHRYKPNEFRVV